MISNFALACVGCRFCTFQIWICKIHRRKLFRSPFSFHPENFWWLKLRICSPGFVFGKFEIFWKIGNCFWKIGHFLKNWKFIGNVYIYFRKIVYLGEFPRFSLDESSSDSDPDSISFSISLDFAKIL